MRFSDLVSYVRQVDLGEPGQSRRPPRDNVRAVEYALRAALTDPEFCVDVLERELHAVLNAKQVIGGPTCQPPFHELRDRGIGFQLFYWTPRRGTAPHEHNSWTVSAVFHHRLSVATYDWDTAVRDRRLDLRNVFVAERGQVGHVYDNCIHAPFNETDRTALSIHLVSSNDGAILRDIVGPIPGLSDGAASFWPTELDFFARAVQWHRRFVLLAHADALSQLPSRRATALLDSVFALGDNVVKWRVVNVMQRLDPDRAMVLRRTLFSRRDGYTATAST